MPRASVRGPLIPARIKCALLCVCALPEREIYSNARRNYIKYKLLQLSAYCLYHPVILLLLLFTGKKYIIIIFLTSDICTYYINCSRGRQTRMMEYLSNSKIFFYCIFRGLGHLREKFCISFQKLNFY